MPRSRLTMLLLIPTLALLGAFLLLPYLNMVVMSFRTPSTSAVFAPGFTTANYLNALLDPDFYYLEILWDTMVLGFWTTLVSLILGFPLAYHLARTQSRLKTLLYFFILSPLLVGVVIRCYGWMIILGPHNGLINTTLKQLNLIENSLPLMFNTFGVSVGLIHVFLPFMILPLLGSIQAVDPALEEASQSLGASRLRTMIKVIVPLSLPGIQAGSILVFVLTISSFVIPILLGSYKVMIMPTLVVQQIMDAMLWPFGAALAFILSISGGFVIYFYLKLTSRLVPSIQ